MNSKMGNPFAVKQPKEVNWLKEMRKEMERREEEREVLKRQQREEADPSNYDTEYLLEMGVEKKTGPKGGQYFQYGTLGKKYYIIVIGQKPYAYSYSEKEARRLAEAEKRTIL